jgi:hypothetical protein
MSLVPLTIQPSTLSIEPNNHVAAIELAAINAHQGIYVN